ncbi:MAG: SusD/RagB family nutrient-binding outer membrane lipoprotein [Mangrovibacterium sp.]
MKKIYLILLITGWVINGCTDKFDNYKEDEKNPEEVPGESLFSNAQKELCDQISSADVNLNIWKIWAQYWTETTYTDEANYDIITRNIPDNTFRFYYRESLKDLDEAYKLIEEAGPGLDEDPAVNQNKLAIIEILTVYAYQNLVDIFGMVPYSEALDIDNVYPKYDTGLEIYQDLFNRLDAAIDALDPDFDSFGTADIYYGGNVNAWIKFGHSLKIKMGITIADSNDDLARSAIESGVQGCFTSSADDCLLAYLQASPNYNPIYAELVATGRHDFVAANTIVDIMNDLEDPRREKFFTLHEGGYVGGQYGYASPYADYSHVADGIQAPDFKGILMTYTEIQFYLAEAAARGYNVPNTAAAYYHEGIRASFAFWEAEGVEAYLLKPEVAWLTAEGTWRQKIALQSWIASYTRGLEGYTTWRRLDYPILNIPQSARVYSDIPVRFTFPVLEQTLNNENYTAAAEEIGGDELTTKIFWDVYPEE